MDVRTLLSKSLSSSQWVISSVGSLTHREAIPKTGNGCGLRFFKVSKISSAPSQMGRIARLNGYGHDYVEKIKFQLCFGVLVMGASSPILPARCVLWSRCRRESSRKTPGAVVHSWVWSFPFDDTLKTQSWNSRSRATHANTYHFHLLLSNTILVTRMGKDHDQIPALPVGASYPSRAQSLVQAGPIRIFPWPMLGLCCRVLARKKPLIEPGFLIGSTRSFRGRHSEVGKKISRTKHKEKQR